MSDLSRHLPLFPVSSFRSVLPTIEQRGITTTDLLTLHPADIAKETGLSILDLKRLIAAVQDTFVDDIKPNVLRFGNDASEEGEDGDGSKGVEGTQQKPAFISTLDPDLDDALGGGVPLGCITEFTGESGCGKTQFLLSLLLSAQLPPPHGLSSKALYISTESKLSTQRLHQIIRSNPLLRATPFTDMPSLDNILSTDVPDLESQEHILEYQVPVMLERNKIGVVVIDSVAANYRAEFERGSRGLNMAQRSADLVRLGATLRDLARRHNIAVVVANQVADRFSSSSQLRSYPSEAHVQESPLASRSMAPPPMPSTFSSTPSGSLPYAFNPGNDGEAPILPALSLDHQQRWFTGWGDDPHADTNLKTPSLGLVWSTQIACRIALFKKPLYGPTPRRVAPPLQADHAGARDEDDGVEDGEDRGTQTLRAWRRWMKVVFAPHVASSGQGVEGAVEYEVTMGGMKAVKKSQPVKDEA